MKLINISEAEVGDLVVVYDRRPHMKYFGVHKVTTKGPDVSTTRPIVQTVRIDYNRPYKRLYECISDYNKTDSWFYNDPIHLGVQSEIFLLDDDEARRYIIGFI